MLTLINLQVGVCNEEVIMEVLNPKTEALSCGSKSKMKGTEKDKSPREKSQDQTKTNLRISDPSARNTKNIDSKKSPRKYNDQTNGALSSRTKTSDRESSTSNLFKKTADDMTSNIRKNRKKSEDISGRRFLPALDVSQSNGKRKFSIVLRERPFTSLPVLYGTTSVRPTKPSQEEKTKKMPPLRRTNTLTRFITFRRIARNMANNFENRKQAMPTKDKISREYWKKAKAWSRLEQKKEIMLPKTLKRFVYRTGKTWKLRATAYVGEPGRMDPDYDPFTGQRRKTEEVETMKVVEEEDKARVERNDLMFNWFNWFLYALFYQRR